MEEWRDVPGWEGLYQVSDDGRVRSLHDGKRYHMKELRQHKVMGYMKAMLYRYPKRKMVAVHRMVAKAFIPNPNNYPQVNHINGIKTDNRAANLEWASAKENNSHAIRTGLKRDPKESNCKAVLVLNKETGTMSEYKSVNEASRQIGLSAGAISTQANKNAIESDRRMSKYYIIFKPEGEINAQEDNEH